MKNKLFSLVICIAIVLFTVGTTLADRPDGKPDNGTVPDDVVITSPVDVVANVPGKNDNAALDIFKVLGTKGGLIKISKDFFYPGDSFSLSVVFPKSLKAIWSGEADINLLIVMPDGTMVKLPLLSAGTPPDQPKSLFDDLKLGIETFPPGIYQFAVILTKSEGDPLLLKDWYNGFQGLIAATTMKFKPACDEEDATCDGAIDPALTVTSNIANNEITVGGVATLTVAGGVAPYTITTTDSAIASVSAATLDNAGTFTVTGLAEGTVTITVTCKNNVTKTVDITVNPATAVPVPAA